MDQMDSIPIFPHGASPPSFDKEAADNYKLAMKFGEAISGWDDPEMVPAAGAIYMRDDDYVVGLVFRGRARAYPLWVVDNYHVVNDSVGSERFLLASCERCQSGAAFVATVSGNPERPPLFRAVGFMNGTLLLKDLRSGSHWIHYEGVGLDRKAAGVRLPWIPTFHMEWKDWIALHPDTEVMLPPNDPIHPDARHGHGREEMFARPGMDPGFITTIVGSLDQTYPENEMVLGVVTEDGWAAYPLREVHREGGVVNEPDGTRPLAVFAGPRKDGFTMAAFSSVVEGQTLTFERKDGFFEDLETGTRWTIEGRALDGHLQDRALEPIPYFYVRWHAWIYFHRDTRLFVSDAGRRAYAPGACPEGWEPFQAVLDALSDAGHEILIGEDPVSQRRPRETFAAVTALVDGDPINLFAFDSETAARDYDSFSGAWSGFPLKPKSFESKTRRLGRIVLESDPATRYVDPVNVVPLPPSVISWAKILKCDCLDDLARHNGAARKRPQGPTSFVDVVRALRLSGLEVIDVGFLPPSQLRVGCLNAVAVTIEAEQFLLYRFPDAEPAHEYAAGESHACAYGQFVLRSTPDTMYLHHMAEIIYAGDEHVRWSKLFDDPRLTKALSQFAMHDPQGQ